MEGAAAFVKAKEYLDATLKNGFSSKNKGKGPALKIILEQVASLPKEGYTLKTTSDQVLIQASSVVGALYGVNSFLALLPPHFGRMECRSLYYLR